MGKHVFQSPTVPFLCYAHSRAENSSWTIRLSFLSPQNIFPAALQIVTDQFNNFHMVES